MFFLPLSLVEEPLTPPPLLLVCLYAGFLLALDVEDLTGFLMVISGSLSLSSEESALSLTVAVAAAAVPRESVSDPEEDWSDASLDRLEERVFLLARHEGITFKAKKC